MDADAHYQLVLLQERPICALWGSSLRGSWAWHGHKLSLNRKCCTLNFPTEERRGKKKKKKVPDQISVSTQHKKWSIPIRVLTDNNVPFRYFLSRLGYLTSAQVARVSLSIWSYLIFRRSRCVTCGRPLSRLPCMTSPRLPLIKKTQNWQRRKYERNIWISITILFPLFHTRCIRGMCRGASDGISQWALGLGAEPHSSCPGLKECSLSVAAGTSYIRGLSVRWCWIFTLDALQIFHHMPTHASRGEILNRGRGRDRVVAHLNKHFKF